MISLTLTRSPATPLPLKPCYFPSLRSILSRHTRYFKQKKLRDGRCRAEFSADAPAAMAIGASIVNSLVFPVTPSREDLEAESLIDTAGARFAVMAIISFIPYFNWMSWVFAWMDTGKLRYVVYAVAYLAPYLRSNLSISPEDSWLPIASIVLCIAHIQLEASIHSSDIQGFPLFRQVARHLPSTKNSSGISEMEGRIDSAEAHYRNQRLGHDSTHRDHEILDEDDETNIDEI